MFAIDMQQASDAFAACWGAAGRHLQTRSQDHFAWLKAQLTAPFLEHLSFRLGNQLFFVRIVCVDDWLEVPGNMAGLLAVADGCRGHPCLMPMRRTSTGWDPDAPGWGLIDARTGLSVDPLSLVTNELIEMTDWEVHDFAVQVVRDQLSEQGREIISSCGNPRVNPSVWFVGDEGPEWVVVRAVRYPLLEAEPPAGWREIAQHCAQLSDVGHFAPVAVASAEDAFTPHAPPTPLWRGHAMKVRFNGLRPPPGAPPTVM
jgi:hypothetical protein